MIVIVAVLADLVKTTDYLKKLGKLDSSLEIYFRKNVTNYVRW